MSRCCIPIPGVAGRNGANGARGAAGADAFTALSAPFTMPAFLTAGDATVDDASWMTVGEPVFVETLGTFQVLNINGHTVSLYNLADGAAAYTQNTPPGPTAIAPATSRVTPSGWQGPDGVAVGGGAPANATYITQTPSADLTNEQSLDGLATGFMRSTTGTGVVTTVPSGVANGNVALVDAVAGLVAGDVVMATAAGLRTMTLAEFIAWFGVTNFNLIGATAPVAPPSDVTQIWQWKALDTGNVWWWNPGTATWIP